MAEIREPRISAAAEREMQKWSLAQQLAERVVRSDAARGTQAKLGPYITISRQGGSGAEEVALRVAEKLGGWDVVDKNILDIIAKQFCLERHQLENLDETRANWVRDTVGLWLDPHVISADKFIACLERVVWATARKGNVIFIGRGVRFLLPSENSLGVRLVASEKYRVARIQKEKGLSESAARRFVRELEVGRRQFVQRFFHKNVEDPCFYDLLLNVELLGVESTAELIVTAWRMRHKTAESVKESRTVATAK